MATIRISLEGDGLHDSFSSCNHNSLDPPATNSLKRNSLNRKSSWNRNIHIKKELIGILIKMEHSYYQKGTLIKMEYSSKWNTHIIKRN